MQFDGAVIKERGVNFAIVVVNPSTLDYSTHREETREAFSRHFPGIPVVLMAQNSQGIPTYSGRTDIVNLLANIDFSKILFKTYTV
ncbi:MAG: hypothetical protein WAQ28_11325 [Bacteroidia bacterium]